MLVRAFCPSWLMVGVSRGEEKEDTGAAVSSPRPAHTPWRPSLGHELEPYAAP